MLEYNNELNQLEKERIGIIFKILFLLFIPVLFIFLTVYLIYLYYFVTNSELDENIFLFLITFGNIMSLSLSLFLGIRWSKKFENKVKEVLLPSVLKEITNKKGEINHDNYNPKYIADNTEKILNIGKSLFNTKFCLFDDIFFGVYNNIKFTLIEYYQTKNNVISGNVIEIPFNLEYKNKLIIIDKKIFITDSDVWKDEIIKGLSNINIYVGFNNPKLKIFSDNPAGVEKILTPKFVDFVNNLDKKYSVAFANGNLYIICNNKKDYFKMGSLFKRIDDEAQYEKFKQQLKECLDIITKAGNLGWNTVNS